MPQPYKLFTIYAREDAQYLEELRGQLRPLEHAGRIKVWSDREINPGVDWEKEIVQNLDSADIILILVSAAYYNSAYIHEKEIKYAINRHERGEAKVLPVIVRPCHFLDDPVISRLQVLPTDGKPVTDRRHWQDRDDAWLDVVAGVKRTLDIIRDAENRTEQEIRDAAERERLAAERKKAEEQRARQAELDARERTERERREAEQRTREEQARYEREAEAARQREVQLKRQREEQERLERLRREQDEAYQRADSTAWLKAANKNDIDAYDDYLINFPQGEMVREARYRIKGLKREDGAIIPWRMYSIIGIGVFGLLLTLWLVSGQSKEQTGQNFLSHSDTTQIAENTNKNLNSGNQIKKRDLFETPGATDKKPSQLQVAEEPKVVEEKTYEMFDIQKPPSFPGGEKELLKFLSENLKYPEMARVNNIQGTVALTFVVGKNGQVSDVQIVKDIGGGCGKEAVRVVQSMPRWNSGEANGRPVKVRFTLPVRFRLEEDSPKSSN